MDSFSDAFMFFKYVKYWKNFLVLKQDVIFGENGNREIKSLLHKNIAFLSFLNTVITGT